MSDLVGNPNCWFSHALAHLFLRHCLHNRIITIFDYGLVTLGPPPFVGVRGQSNLRHTSGALVVTRGPICANEGALIAL